MNTSGKGENSKTSKEISNSTNLYSLKRNDDHVFEFTTALGVRYKTYFLDYRVVFEHYPDIIGPVYSFGVEVLEANPSWDLSLQFTYRSPPAQADSFNFYLHTRRRSAALKK
jgi:hypothetical protein